MHPQSERIDRVLDRVRSLQRSRKARETSSQFWIEGIRQFIQAFEAGIDFETVIVSRKLLKNHLVQMMIDQLLARGVACARISPEQFRSISICQRASGIGAIVKQHWRPLESTDAHHGLCWLIIEHLRSPGNLGTILRTVDAVGGSGVVLVGDTTDPYHPSAVRASVGTVFRLPFIRIQTAEGVDMELNPRPVDVPVTRPVGEGYTDHDSQLDAAVRELLGKR